MITSGGLLVWPVLLPLGGGLLTLCLGAIVDVAPHVFIVEQRPLRLGVVTSSSRRLDLAFTSTPGVRGSFCQPEATPVAGPPRWLNDTYGQVDVAASDASRLESNVYVCFRSVTRTESFGSVSILPNKVIKWIYTGENVTLPESQQARARRELASSSSMKPSSDLRSPRHEPVLLYGLKVEVTERAADYDDDGVPGLLLGNSAKLRLFGTGFSDDLVFVLTTKLGEWGDVCELPATEKYKLIPDSIKTGSALLQMTMPELGLPDSRYYFCYKREGGVNLSTHDTAVWMHLGSEPYQSVRSYAKLLPVYVSIIVIVLCLSFSSLFSGLNLGLMSLDKTDLKIIANTGNKNEKKYAKAIAPVRAHGNYLLCSILLGNVMVNSTFTILLDDLTSGLVAVIASTLLIVIFGEISPQAVCSRHGLAVGAKTIYITKVVMALTFPLSYPISKALDWILGEEIGNVYTRDRLKELVKLTTDELQKDEVNIISGALELSQKIVRDVMTNIEDVYMLSIDAVLDFETVSDVMQSGFSRIPVYEGSRSNIVTVLYIKDLALVDPDDNTPLRTHCEFYQTSCFFVFEDTTLDIIFKQLKEGNRGHMAFVHRVNNEGEGDPFYETIGLITLEDVIEELIQAEIIDETDVYTDNRSKRKRKERKTKTDFSIFAEKSENQKVRVSPQLIMATFQFMATSIDAFKPEHISESVLHRLLKQDVFHQIKVKDKKKDDHGLIIYEQGKPVDYFVLILEGRVEVTVGRENLNFESGSFTYFGSQALIQNVGVVDSPTSGSQQAMGSLQSVNIDSKMRATFVPDYSVRAITDVFFVKVKRSMYLVAKRATLMEWSKREESTGGETFDDEMSKLLNTLGGEDTRSQGSPDVTRTQSQHQSGKTSPQPLQNGPLTHSEPFLAQHISPTSPSGGDVHPPLSNTTDETSKLLNPS